MATIQEITDVLKKLSPESFDEIQVLKDREAEINEMIDDVRERDQGVATEESERRVNEALAEIDKLNKQAEEECSEIFKSFDDEDEARAAESEILDSAAEQTRDIQLASPLAEDLLLQELESIDLQISAIAKEAVESAANKR